MTISKRLALALAGTAMPAMAAPLDGAGRTAVLAHVDAARPQMDKAALDIWKFAEVGFQETKSSALLQQQLKAAGFAIEAGVAGMPTAFIARFRGRRQRGGPVTIQPICSSCICWAI